MTSDPTAPVPPGRSDRMGRLLLLGPGLLYLTVLFLLPIAAIVGISFLESNRFGQLRWEVTFASFERALDPLYLRVLATSVVIAGITTLLAVLIGYPTAWAIARLPPRWRLVVLILVVLPFWTNFLVRTYAWIVLLNTEGPISGVLQGVGLIESPLQLLYTPGAVIAGLLYAYLPLMILPLYVAIDRLDPELREAARDLGASRARVFLTVTLPMTLPGALVGAIFVFVPSLGNFVIPELLGGGKTVMIGNLIRDQFLKTRNWPLASVLALSILGILLVLLILQSRLSRRYAPVSHD
ncbi:MAG: ABC transporter permease [Chloroflexi bacterium]|nr:ABC transporter permease [Chloroflexota bacterium]